MKKFLHKGEFLLERGGMLRDIEITYHTIGNLNASRSNVVWVCHALTANSDVSDWWNGLVGQNCLFNPEDHFIVCANVLGGCYGTTGPMSLNPHTGRKYFQDFPRITIRDMVKAHGLLAQHLGIDSIWVGIGGSLGGQQILEWAVQSPTLFENLILLATNAKHSPWGIAFNEAQRMAIECDVTWHVPHDNAAAAGLRAARAMALLSYRNYETYNDSQEEVNDVLPETFKASSYQRYQGRKLSNRFSAYSYWTLTHAMDSHNIARGRGSLFEVLASVKSRTKVIGISSDLLFPLNEQILIAEQIPNATFSVIETQFGHDGFLIETKKISEIVSQFLLQASKSSFRLEEKTERVA